VLISSAEQLAWEGLAGYVRSYLETAKQLKLGSRRDCTVLPAPFVLLGSSTDQHLLRVILEFHAWIRISGADADGVLNDSFGVIEHNIRSSPGNGSQTLMSVTYKIPLNVKQDKESCVISAGITNLPSGVKPVTEATERLIVTAMVRNLNTVFVTKLDCDPVTCRNPANSSKECLDYLLIGGPHAASIAAQLTAEGVKAQHLDLPFYRQSSVQPARSRRGWRRCPSQPQPSWWYNS
jgi:hypothetical protein